MIGKGHPGRRASHFVSRLRQISPAALGYLVLALTAGALYNRLLSWQPMRTQERAWLYLRPLQYLTDIRAGEFPPQLFPDAFGGAGMAFPLFYPPLAQWTAAGLVALMGDGVVGVHLSLFASVLLSGLAFHLLAREAGATRTIAMAGSIAYMSFPYRMVDIFVRGALAESWAFVWYPLVIVGGLRLVRNERLPTLLPIAVAGLLLTHAVLGLWFLTLCAAIWLTAWPGRHKLAAQLGLGAAIGLGLTAWHVLPAQNLLSTVWAGDPRFIWADSAHIAAQAIRPAQLLRSDAAHWRGYSPADMGYALGILEWLAVPAGLLWLLPQWERRRAPGRLALPALGAAVLCAVFSFWPGPLLRILPGFYDYIQFPWRLLGFAGFFSSMAATLFLAGVRVPRMEPWILVATMAIAFLRPAYERSAPRVSAVASLPSNSPLSTTGSDLGLTVLGEYLPRTVRPDDLGAELEPMPAFVKGSGQVTVQRRVGETAVRGWSQTAASLRLPLVSYPLYRVSGTPAHLSQAGGLLVLDLPPGQVDVRLVRKPPPLWGAALALTLLSVASLAALSVHNALAVRRTRGSSSHPSQANEVRSGPIR